MTLLRWLAAIAVVGICVHWWQERREERAIQAATSPSGFLPVPMPDGAARNTVLVFAPLNCPREGAQRANALTEKLTSLGIPNVKTDHYGSQVFEPTPEIEASFKRLNVLMKGEIPIVMINGMGKANPSAEEVVAEFRRTQ